VIVELDGVITMWSRAPAVNETEAVCATTTESVVSVAV